MRKYSTPALGKGVNNMKYNIFTFTFHQVAFHPSLGRPFTFHLQTFGGACLVPSYSCLPPGPKKAADSEQKEDYSRKNQGGAPPGPKKGADSEQNRRSVKVNVKLNVKVELSEPRESETKVFTL
jgi:hypothetical protein